MKKYTIKRSLIGSVLFLCLVSCAHFSPSPFSPVYLTDRSAFKLLDPQEIEYPMDNYQHITGTYGKDEFLMDAWVIADDTGIEMTLFNSFGAGMGEAYFRDNQVYFSSQVFPSSLKPEYIIADFQLCFYRIGALTERLKDCGLDFAVITDAGNGEKSRELRTVSDGGKIIIEIEKTSSEVKYTNLLRKYSYTLSGDFQ
jgi:hypothetical protein